MLVYYYWVGYGCPIKLNTLDEAFVVDYGWAGPELSNKSIKLDPAFYY